MLRKILLFWWLFHSLTGINAIIHYYMDNYCGETLDISGTGAIKLSLTWGDYDANMDCVTRIRTASSNRMMVYFISMRLESDSTCSNDYLELVDGQSIVIYPHLTPRTKYCGTTYPTRVMTSSGNYITLKFVSDATLEYSGFDMIITPYHTGSCYSSEFSCNNGRCIDYSDVCNTYNPCGDESDCSSTWTFSSATGSAATGIIVGCIVSGLVVVIVIAVVVFVICRIRRPRSGPAMSVNYVPTVASTVQQTPGTMAGASAYPAAYNNPGAYSQPGAYLQPGTYPQTQGANQQSGTQPQRAYMYPQSEAYAPPPPYSSLQQAVEPKTS